MMKHWEKNFCHPFLEQGRKREGEKNRKAIAKVFESKSPGLKANPFQNS